MHGIVEVLYSGKHRETLQHCELANIGSFYQCQRPPTILPSVNDTIKLSQNNYICVNSTYHDSTVATLSSMSNVQRYSCVCFFIRTWLQTTTLSGHWTTQNMAVISHKNLFTEWKICISHDIIGKLKSSFLFSLSCKNYAQFLGTATDGRTCCGSPIRRFATSFQTTCTISISVPYNS